MQAPQPPRSVKTPSQTISTTLRFTALAAVWGAFFSASAAPSPEACRVEIVEKTTGWPVPMVELRTTHNYRFVSDNAGVVAFDLPELMGVETWFDVIAHGYEVPKDGFGSRGVRLKPVPGATLKVEVSRKNIAKRLGRITGAGAFGESQKLGRELNWREPGVLGCDSVQNAVYGDKMIWVWGDTTMARYPLGIFHATAAFTPVKPLSDFKPPIRLKLDYVTDDQHAPRAVARLPGDGPTWLSAVTTVPDKNGTPKLVATYAKIKPPLEAYEYGLCIWDDKLQSFTRHKVIWSKSDQAPKPPPLPDGHSFLWKDTTGKSWVFFGNPLPTLRCPATYESWQDPSAWENLQPQESLASAADGKPVKPHSGAVAFSPFRKRFVTVFMERFGKPSAFGELWYAEADLPTGPWGKTVKIISHDNYTFYNPRLHPEFTAPDSPILIFEGTYTREFADRAFPTPRWDYNQVLYRLDLDDAALSPCRGL